MAISLTEPRVKTERRTKDGTKYTEFCVCIWVENDSDQDVEGDITFWKYYPGAITPVQGELCTKTKVKVPKKKTTPHGEAKGREEVCCCKSDGLIELNNGEGRIMAAWGKKDRKGLVTIEKAEETKGMTGPVRLP